MKTLPELVKDLTGKSDPAEQAAALTEMKARADKAVDVEAAAPVLAQVRALTGKDKTGDQVVALAEMASRASRADALQSQLGGEREHLVKQLQARKVPPVVIKSLEAACDAAGGDLTALRAAAGSPAVQGIEAAKPGAVDTSSDPAPEGGTGKVVVTDRLRAEYGRMGVRDDAEIERLEKARLEREGKKSRRRR